MKRSKMGRLLETTLFLVLTSLPLFAPSLHLFSFRVVAHVRNQKANLQTPPAEVTKN